MSWETDLLSALGAPPTQQNLDFLQAWGQREGANDYNNPLNITHAYLGGASGTFNSVGVLEFPNLATGVDNTAAFLQHGYSSIVSGLKSGNPWGYPGIGSELSSWSGGAYSGFAPSPLSPATEATTTGGLFGGTALGALLNPSPNPNATVGNYQVPDWFAAITQPFSDWWRAHPIGLLLVAIFVVIIGIVLIGTDKNVQGSLESISSKGAVVAA